MFIEEQNDLITIMIIAFQINIKNLKYYNEKVRIGTKVLTLLLQIYGRINKVLRIFD